MRLARCLLFAQESLHRFLPQLRLVNKIHVARIGQDHELRSGDLLVHLFAQAGVALVVVAGHISVGT